MDEPVLVASDANDPTPGSTQEIDVWWGAYSGWTMLPSMLVCVGLTAAIFTGAWLLVERAYVQGAVWPLVGLVWLVQLLRFHRRVLARSYRLTTRRVLMIQGHLFSRRRQMNLRAVDRIVVTKTKWSGWAGVGNVVLFGKGGDKLVLDGVRGAKQVAERIRAMLHPAVAASPEPARAGTTS